MNGREGGQMCKYIEYSPSDRVFVPMIYFRSITEIFVFHFLLRKCFEPPRFPFDKKSVRENKILTKEMLTVNVDTNLFSLNLKFS